MCSIAGVPKGVTSLLSVMKKDPNSEINQIDNRDRSLPRSKILRGRRNFQRLFERSQVLRTPSIHLRYRFYEDPSEGCHIGFIVKKKLGKAARRNRIKRWLREAYRTHQYLLSDLFDAKKFGFHGVFMIQHTKVNYHSIEDDMITLLEEVRVKMQHYLDSHQSFHYSKNEK
jgi:ribonuclease P protein component